MDRENPIFSMVSRMNFCGKAEKCQFSAIQFVLSDEYAHLKEEQRLGLLHESTGPKVAHARVEITFDNSEKRLMAFENSEVKIVRQVGKKKDQYYIDNKMVPRAEVFQLWKTSRFIDFSSISGGKSHGIRRIFSLKPVLHR